MGTRIGLMVLGLALGLAVLLLASAGAADKPAAKQIAQLIEQLGSNSYEEREQATKKLAEIGMPALDALRKALASGDPEIQKRAEELIHRLDAQIQQEARRAESAKLLTASKIHLVYKETPLAEAVADFAKKSGYTIQLHDPENKLSGRKVSLDTGIVTFWEAFDRFCTAAGLVDASLQDVLVPRQGGRRPQPLQFEVPIPLQPGQPDRPAGGAAPGLPIPAPKIQPAQPRKEEADPDTPKQGVPAPGAKIQPVPPAIGRAVQVRRAPAVRLQPGNAAIAAGIQGSTQPTTIVLKDGKPETVPTCYAGAVRIRALTGKSGKAAAADQAAPDDQVVVPVEARSEPRMQLQSITAVKITKALDDRNQSLDQLIDSTVPNVPQFIGPAGIIIGPAGVPAFNRPQSYSPSQVVSVRLKKAPKDSQTLKELNGTLTAEALLAPETLATVENILQAAGKEIKGKDGSTLKVIGVQSINNRVTVRIQIDPPPAGPPVPRIQKVPAIQKVPIPIPQAVPNGGLFQIQPQPAPAIPIQIQIGQIGGFGPNIKRELDGLKLLDGNGQVIPRTQTGYSRHVGANGQMTVTYNLGYRLQNGQVPSKLVYTSSRSVTLDIPFTLKDVPVK